MNDIKVGNPLPLGSSVTSRGVNFSLVATNAEYIEILLFDNEDAVDPKKIFKLDHKHKTGPYWHAEINDLKEEIKLCHLLSKNFKSPIKNF